MLIKIRVVDVMEEFDRLQPNHSDLGEVVKERTRP